MHLFLPREMGLGSKAVAHLKRCVYGTRDAGMLWEECYSEALVQMGFRRGLANPCCFYHPEKHISLVVHGDDFTALEPRDSLLWYEKGLAQSVELKLKGRLGEAADCDKEVRVLTRVVRIDDEGISMEADPRHVEMLIQAAGLSFESKPSVVPGAKAQDVDYDAVLQDIESEHLAGGSMDKDPEPVQSNSSHTSIPRESILKRHDSVPSHHDKEVSFCPELSTEPPPSDAIQ